MTLELIQTNAYKRDIRKLVKQGKDLEELYTILEMLVSEQPLPVKYRDHVLTGNWRGRRECHIHPDWLLIYKVEGQILYLERSGSHSELFS